MSEMNEWFEVSEKRNDDVININISGKIYSISRAVLEENKPNLIYSSLVNGDGLRDKEGYLFYQRDPAIFLYIIDYLSGYYLDAEDPEDYFDTIDETELPQILSDAKYFGFGELEKYIQESIDRILEDNDSDVEDFVNEPVLKKIVDNDNDNTFNGKVIRVSTSTQDYDISFDLLTKYPTNQILIDLKNVNGIVQNNGLNIFYDRSSEMVDHIVKYMQGYKINYNLFDVCKLINLKAEGEFFKLPLLIAEIDKYLDVPNEEDIKKEGDQLRSSINLLQMSGEIYFPADSLPTPWKEIVEVLLQALKNQEFIDHLVELYKSTFVATKVNPTIAQENKIFKLFITDIFSNIIKKFMFGNMKKGFNTFCCNQGSDVTQQDIPVPMDVDQLIDQIVRQTDNAIPSPTIVPTENTDTTDYLTNLAKIVNLDKFDLGEIDTIKILDNAQKLVLEESTQEETPQNIANDMIKNIVSDVVKAFVPVETPREAPQNVNDIINNRVSEFLFDTTKAQPTPTIQNIANDLIKNVMGEILGDSNDDNKPLNNIFDKLGSFGFNLSDICNGKAKNAKISPNPTLD